MASLPLLFLLAQLQPFTIPWNEAAPNFTNLRSWQADPAGSNGFVKVSPDGHYEVNGQRIRFLGVNITASSAFPTPERADAHAARLARFGYNSVRFHHMEAPWDKNNVLVEYSKGSSRQLSPQRLDRLHYFVNALAQQGIYSNLNLLVSREFQPADGLGPEISQLGWKDQHILGFFNDAAVALQKEYATQLLTAPNPYRDGKPLAQDPAVAFVEILNENGLLQKWHESVLDNLPAVYRSQLESRWNQWLKNRYTNMAELQTAWGILDLPLGPSLLRNGDFSAGANAWNVERHNGAAATVTAPADFNGNPSLRIDVTTPGTDNWHVQINQASIKLESGAVYTVSFWAKAAAPAPLNAAVGRAYGDYATLYSGPNVVLSTQWRQYSFTFQSNGEESNARINFNGFGNIRATVSLANIQFQPGGKIGALPDGRTLEDGNIPNVPKTSASAAPTRNQKTDWIRFLLWLESNYWSEMKRFLKEDLGYQGLVWGTILSNSTPNTQASMDAFDSHAYWQHPTFPPGRDFNPTDWTVQNRSMLDDPNGGAISGLARQRIQGRPHNVTEYQHSSPNSYVAEGPLLAAAYGALQDWDGIWFFEYTTNTTEFTTGYFDQGGNPGRMVNSIIAAALFRRGDVSPAQNEITMAFDPETELNIASTRGGAWSVGDGAQLGVPANLALVSRLSLSIGSDAKGRTTSPAAPNGLTFFSDTRQLAWDRSRGKGIFLANTPKSKVLAGYSAGLSMDFDGVVFAPAANRLGWCTLALTLMEGNSIEAAAGGRALIVATGDHENTNQRWTSEAKNSVANNWGQAPTLIEPIPATITLPLPADRVTVWSLDARGERMNPVPIRDANGKAQFDLGSSGATLWYEVSLAPAPQ